MSEEQLRTRIQELEQELEGAHLQAKTLGDLLEKKLNEIYTLYHVSRTVSSLLDIHEMLRQVSGIIKKSIPFDRISLYLLDDNKEALDLHFFSGLDVHEKVSILRGEGTPGRIFENGEHVHIHDLSVFYETFNDFIHFPGESKRSGSYIGIALKVHNITIGVIGMDSSVKFGLGVDDMDLMAELSHQIAAGIEKSRLFEQIQQLSQIDGLTGLYNHRIFQEKLRQEVNRRNRTQKPLSLIMLDIDHFKQVNDNYGHQSGDSILKELSEIITSQSRCTTIDVCCRYGGEEFAIIMPELELHNAVKVAERLRKVVENNGFRIKEGDPDVKVTVSLGAAGVTGADDLSPEELVKKADEALYLSKKNGRNRVSFSPLDPVK
ncbi:MAG TPA: sensor domain-containing diguanylate cyclase [Nitrospirota bacterium]|nr:sensor domain-containing diguanylate cyclase [Nitrospirota bacterium]